MISRIRYLRLPGRKMGFLRCPSAWMGDDHILMVGGTRFHEIYSRVYFRDVQALVVKRKARFVMQWPYIVPVIAALVAEPFVWATFGNSLFAAGNMIILGSLLLAGIILAFYSLRFGCHFYLATAVGNVYVRSVASTRTARRFSQRVTPEITRAQAPAEPVVPQGS